MKRVLLVIAALAAAGGFAPAFGASSVSQSVAVCDPKFPDRCIKPAADGSIAVTGGGGSGGGTSSTYGATFPTTGTAVGFKDSAGTAMAAGNLDASGNLKVNVAAGSAANAAASATGSAVPASADYQGVNIGGTLRGQTGVNPTGTTYAGATDLTSIGGTTVVNGGVAGSQSVGGTVATNVAITDNPLNLGAQAVSSENAAVTTARKVQLVADLVGKQIVLPYANPENFVSGTTSAMTGTTSTSLIASPGGSLRNYITQISCVNSHATVGTFVTVQDGSGGTALYTLAAGSVFGGSAYTFPVPLRQPTTATALYVANVTTGANVICSATGYKGL